MKASIIYSALIFISMGVVAQPKIEFEKKVHDFGTIDEHKGPVSHKFLFTNTGNAPLSIQSVKASCGCTTPDWTKSPVLPGEHGYVIAKYDPSSRPGAFNKSLTINSDAEPQLLKVYIKGVVNPRPKSPEDEYPLEMGNLRARYRSFYMGRIKTDQPHSKKFDVYNNADKPLVFRDQAKAPEHIKVDYDPVVIPPHSRGYIEITYDAQKKNDFGTVFDHIILYTTEENEAAKHFRVQATIEEYFPPITEEEIKDAPQLSIEERTFEFGAVNQGEKVETTFKLKNTGRETLNIRTIKSTCGCTVANLDKYDLKPGEMVELNVTFDSENRRGLQHKSITIYSNDPQRPAQRVTLKGRVNAS